MAAQATHPDMNECSRSSIFSRGLLGRRRPTVVNFQSVMQAKVGIKADPGEEYFQQNHNNTDRRNHVGSRVRVDEVGSHTRWRFEEGDCHVQTGVWRECCAHIVGPAKRPTRFPKTAPK